MTDQLQERKQDLSKPVPVRAHIMLTQWLSSAKWDLFLTLTDPGLSHPEAMHKRTRYYLNQINRELYGPKFWKRTTGIEHVIGIERQKRGSAHSHSVIRIPTLDVQDPKQFDLQHWRKVAADLGGWSKLELPRSSEDTVDYVTKYVCKEGELYFSEGLNPHNPRTYGQTLLGKHE